MLKVDTYLFGKKYVRYSPLIEEILRYKPFRNLSSVIEKGRFFEPE